MSYNETRWLLITFLIASHCFAAEKKEGIGGRGKKGMESYFSTIKWKEEFLKQELFFPNQLQLNPVYPRKRYLHF